MKKRIFLFAGGVVAALCVICVVLKRKRPTDDLPCVDPSVYEHVYFIAGVITANRLSEKYNSCKTIILYPGIYNDSRYNPRSSKIYFQKRLEGIFAGAKRGLDILSVTPIMTKEDFLETIKVHPDCQLAIFITAGEEFIRDCEKKQFPEGFPDIVFFHPAVSFSPSERVAISSSITGTPISCLIEKKIGNKAEYVPVYLELERKWKEDNQISYRKYNKIFDSTNEVVWRDE